MKSLNKKMKNKINKRKKIVYAGFAADILHEGHINILKSASKLGKVIVGLLTDEAITSYKKLPHLNYKQREIIIKSTSIKPYNVAINDTWQVTGWEMDDPGGQEEWDPIQVGNDVEIIRYGTQGGEGSTITHPDSTTGSQIKLKLNKLLFRF